MGAVACVHPCSGPRTASQHAVPLEARVWRVRVQEHATLGAHGEASQVSVCGSGRPPARWARWPPRPCSGHARPSPAQRGGSRKSGHRVAAAPSEGSGHQQAVACEKHGGVVLVSRQCRVNKGLVQRRRRAHRRARNAGLQPDGRNLGSRQPRKGMRGRRRQSAGPGAWALGPGAPGPSLCALLGCSGPSMRRICVFALRLHRALNEARAPSWSDGCTTFRLELHFSQHRTPRCLFLEKKAHDLGGLVKARRIWQARSMRFFPVRGRLGAPQ